jgi:hypothetical protein
MIWPWKSCTIPTMTTTTATSHKRNPMAAIYPSAASSTRRPRESLEAMPALGGEPRPLAGRVPRDNRPIMSFVLSARSSSAIGSRRLLDFLLPTAGSVGNCFVGDLFVSTHRYASRENLHPSARPPRSFRPKPNSRAPETAPATPPHPAS